MAIPVEEGKTASAWFAIVDLCSAIPSVAPRNDTPDIEVRFLATLGMTRSRQNSARNDQFKRLSCEWGRYSAG